MKLVQLTQDYQTRDPADPIGERTVQITRPFWVNPERVRSVRPRTEGPGTRVEFDISAVIVVEPLDEVVAMLTVIPPSA